jgi:hypothetical protein
MTARMPARGLADAAARIGRGWMAGGLAALSGPPTSSHFALAVVALFDVRFEAHSGLKSDIAPSPESADCVAKVPKRRAAKFPPKDKTSGNRRSMSLQTRHRSH